MSTLLGIILNIAAVLVCSCFMVSQISCSGSWTKCLLKESSELPSTTYYVLLSPSCLHLPCVINLPDWQSDVVFKRSSSAAVRTVAYCCRAAYLGGNYRPALEGTFLAFLNAGTELLPYKRPIVCYPLHMVSPA